MSTCWCKRACPCAPAPTSPCASTHPCSISRSWPPRFGLAALRSCFTRRATPSWTSAPLPSAPTASRSCTGAAPAAWGTRVCLCRRGGMSQVGASLHPGHGCRTGTHRSSANRSLTQPRLASHPLQRVRAGGRHHAVHRAPPRAAPVPLHGACCSWPERRAAVTIRSLPACLIALP